MTLDLPQRVQDTTMPTFLLLQLLYSSNAASGLSNPLRHCGTSRTLPPQQHFDEYYLEWTNKFDLPRVVRRSAFMTPLVSPAESLGSSLSFPSTETNEIIEEFTWQPTEKARGLFIQKNSGFYIHEIPHGKNVYFA